MIKNKMVKIVIDYDELYPFYFFANEKVFSYDVVVEVPEKKVKEWEKIIEKFRKYQEELKKLYKKSKGYKDD